MRRRMILAALASAGLPSASLAAGVEHSQCSTILPLRPASSTHRALTPEDLVRIRDIGPADPQNFPARSFTLSPDGRRVAFQLRRADPDRNDYCLAMIVVDLSNNGSARVVDRGGDPILLTIDLRGIADVPGGWMQTITPRWSPDGKSIFFLKRVAGTTQVWQASADGAAASEPLTHSHLDITDFRLSADGASIIYETLPGIEKQGRENAREGLNGWHYDDRFAPMMSRAPLALDPVERQVEVLNLATARIRAASAEEAATLSSDDGNEVSTGQSPGSAGLEITRLNIFGVAPAGALHAHLASGATSICAAAPCEGATHPWWAPGGTHVRFIRLEGWARASTAIYDWDTRSGRVQRLYVTDDVLTSCTPDGRTLICLIDSSLVPGRLERLDPATGRRTILFDPNPEFASLNLGTPIRLHWRNAFGIETLADLVLPVGYRPGRRYPMIIVQYDTRGFLRGGTDDEYPIQAFANRGYAVLSFRRPALIAELRGANTPDEVGRIDLEGFADRRSVESSLEKGVRLAVERGIADPKRIGITGLSDGSSTVEWALIHTSLFAAAAISTCCWDPVFEADVGPSAARHFRAEGWPGVLDSSNPFWKQVSLLANARRISTPILVSAADEELPNAILSFTGLREAGVPIDMFVFPGEYHGRWQPAHRLATYRRSLDWFDYWLRGIRSDAPDRQNELKEWDRLKREGGHGHPV